MRKTKEFLALILVFSMLFSFTSYVLAADKYTATTTTEGGATVQWEYELEGDNIVNLVCKNISEIVGKVEIPSTIDGKTVLKIGDNAFQSCYGMTEIVFPETLTYIGKNAFENCTGLKNLELSNNITSVGTETFRGDTGLKNVTLSQKLTALNYGMFNGCTGLVTIKIPDNVTTIFGSSSWDSNKLGAFRECAGLKSIVIPETVSTIQQWAFYNVENLTVYGVKGSYAEEWANENGYTFDVIENYNPNGTTENVGPKVTAINVVSPNSGTYKSPQTVKLNVVFSEDIKGTTVPTLKIKFGTSAERTVTNGVISGKNIQYSYNIQDGDEGQLQTVSLDGGTITDANGNAAVLTCPIIGGNSIVANKDGIVTNTTENQDKTNNGGTSGTTTSETTGSTKSSSSSSTGKTDPEDSTTANKILPNTGKNIAIIGIISLVIILAISGAAKYYKYKDIK